MSCQHRELYTDVEKYRACPLSSANVWAPVPANGAGIYQQEMGVLGPERCHAENIWRRLIFKDARLGRTQTGSHLSFSPRHGASRIPIHRTGRTPNGQQGRLYGTQTSHDKPKTRS